MLNFFDLRPFNKINSMLSIFATHSFFCLAILDCFFFYLSFLFILFFYFQIWHLDTHVTKFGWLLEQIFARFFLQGMAWNGMKDDFSIFHTGNFLPFHFHSIQKIFRSIFDSMLKFSSIFHSILKFSSIFHSILPYQRNFRLEAIKRIFCCFALGFSDN